MVRTLEKQLRQRKSRARYITICTEENEQINIERKNNALFLYRTGEPDKKMTIVSICDFFAKRPIKEFSVEYFKK